MVIEESRLKFEFPEQNKVLKFDDTKFYRNEFNSMPGAKGVDFISLDKSSVAFIEIKNCLGDEANCRWRITPDNRKRETSHTTVDVDGRNSLDIEVAEKMAMTLAALSGAYSFGDSRSALKEITNFSNMVLEKYLNYEKRRYVILFLEGEFGCHTRSKKMIMSELERSMNVKLRWLNCRVSVVDSDTYNSEIFKLV